MLRIGYWYNVEPVNQVYQIKLIPSERYLETQDSKQTYYEVLERHTNNSIVSGIIGTVDECSTYLSTRYIIKDTSQILTDRIQAVKEELENDRKFLKKGVDKKFKEIAYHLQDALELLEKLEDYEDKGLGDIKY